MNWRKFFFIQFQHILNKSSHNILDTLKFFTLYSSTKSDYEIKNLNFNYLWDHAIFNIFGIEDSC